jgi:bacterioferritin-associated ferredoxin
MSRPMFQDWAMWALVCSIEDCTDDTRETMQRFVQFSLSRVIAKWPQYKGQFCEYLGGSSDSASDRLACRMRCGGRFDEHINRTRKKPWLLSRRPKVELPTYEDYAATWSRSAAWIIRTMFNEDMLPDIQRLVSLDAPLDPNVEDSNSKASVISNTEIQPDQEVVLADDKAVLYPRLLRLQLSTRERLVLWAKYHQKNICGQEMQALAGVGKEQCSKCSRELRERLRLEVIEMSNPESVPAAVVEAITDWALWTLVDSHEGFYPTKEAGGTVIWRKIETQAIFQPEKQKDGIFLWKEAATSPQP